jgi:hypothetical protein
MKKIDATPHYVRNETTGERHDAATLAQAREIARRLRAEGCARLFIARPTGRIVAAWDRAEDGRWQRTI